jgi:cytidyltransferase-like protein
MTIALIFGKFLPPHRGHRYLAEEARRQADEVIVCLLANSAETIPVEMRHAWLEEILPWATVRSAVADHPIDCDDPSGDSDSPSVSPMNSHYRAASCSDWASRWTTLAVDEGSGDRAARTLR